MKKTDVTGRTYVGDLRLADIDVGFSLLKTGRNKIVRPKFPFASAGFTAANGRTYLIEGTEDEILAELAAAGFEIIQTPD